MCDPVQRPEVRSSLRRARASFPRKRGQIGGFGFRRLTPGGAHPKQHSITCTGSSQKPSHRVGGRGHAFRGPPRPLKRARARRRLTRARLAGGGGCGRWRRARALSLPRAGSRSRAGAEAAVAAAAAAAAAEAARGEGREGGGWGGMDPARRPQRQEPALELEPRRWRRRRLLLPSPPVSECPRPGCWRRPRPLSPSASGGESREGSVARRRRRRWPGFPLAAWRRSDPWSPPFGAGAPGLGLVLRHPAGPFSFPARSAVISTLGLLSPPPPFAPFSARPPSRAEGREGRVRSWAGA